MTSKYEDIQQIYNKIRDYRLLNGELPTQLELNTYIDHLIGTNSFYFSRSLCHRKPFSRKQKIPIQGYFNNLIVFVERNVTIAMSNDMLGKIPILRSIILEKNGSDKPLRLRGNYEGNEIEGALLYLTKLPMDGLYFDKPPGGYDIKKVDRPDEPRLLETYFVYSNVEEALVNDEWYS
jgi:hypothetical protein